MIVCERRLRTMLVFFSARMGWLDKTRLSTTEVRNELTLRGRRRLDFDLSRKLRLFFILRKLGRELKFDSHVSAAIQKFKNPT